MNCKECQENVTDIKRLVRIRFYDSQSSVPVREHNCEVKSAI